MIYDLRTDTIRPGKLGQYVERTRSAGRPIRGDRFGRLLGYWTTDLGPLSQVVHLWEYDDPIAQLEARASLAKDERWVREYATPTGPLLQTQEAVTLALADWCQLRPMTGMSIYELRIYRLEPGAVHDWVRHFGRGIEARERYSPLVGLWTTLMGPLNTAFVLWAYRDSSHRLTAREAGFADPVWKETVDNLGPLEQAIEARLLIPSDFSPLR